MGYSMQFRKFLGRKVLIHTKKGEKVVGELVGEDPWFLYLEKVNYANKDSSRQFRAISIHKGRISLLIELGEEQG